MISSSVHHFIASSNKETWSPRNGPERFDVKLSQGFHLHDLKKPGIRVDSMFIPKELFLREVVSLESDVRMNYTVFYYLERAQIKDDSRQHPYFDMNADSVQELQLKEGEEWAVVGLDRRTGIVELQLAGSIVLGKLQLVKEGSKYAADPQKFLDLFKQIGDRSNLLRFCDISVTYSLVTGLSFEISNKNKYQHPQHESYFLGETRIELKFPRRVQKMLGELKTPYFMCKHIRLENYPEKRKVAFQTRTNEICFFESDIIPFATLECSAVSPTVVNGKSRKILKIFPCDPKMIYGEKYLYVKSESWEISPLEHKDVQYISFRLRPELDEDKFLDRRNDDELPPTIINCTIVDQI